MFKGFVNIIGEDVYAIGDTHVKLIDETDSVVPLVTVTMITYNHEKFIEDAINGVLKQQTSFKYVLLIGDDCSTDTTRDIIIKYQKLYPEKIVLKLPEKNLGIAANWISNKFFCKGKYIAECEGDDFWIDPYKLQKQVELLEQNDNYVICCHDTDVLKEDGNLHPDIRLPHDKYVATAKEVMQSYFIRTCSAVFRRSRLDLLDWMLKTRLGDYALWCSLLKDDGKVIGLKDVMAVYRMHAGGVWSMRDTSRYIQEIVFTKYHCFRTIKGLDKTFFEHYLIRLADDICLNGFKNFSILLYYKILFHGFLYGYFPVKNIVYLLTVAFRIKRVE